MIHATIIGRLGHDVSVKTTNGGATFSEMDVACDIGYGDRKTTEWVRVTAFGKLGETCARFLAKGSQAVFIGQLEVNRYTGKDGTAKAQLQLNASHVKFMGGKSDGQGHGQSGSQSLATSASQPPSDDIPF